MAICRLALIGVLVILIPLVSAVEEEHGDAHHHDGHEHKHEQHADDSKDFPPVKEEEMEYHKGSLCGYCTYCKFCRLCEQDCPCEQGPTKPNCHMCKYCKYCYLCKVCDTVCQPGGVIDRISSKLFSTLPKYNKEEIDSDIDGVKHWIEKTKDEL